MAQQPQPTPYPTAKQYAIARLRWIEKEIDRLQRERERLQERIKREDEKAK